MALSVLFIVIIFLILRKQEQFSNYYTWDPTGTSLIQGKKWQYGGPTTRVEYKFIKKTPDGKSLPVAPITWNSFQNGLKCNM